VIELAGVTKEYGAITALHATSLVFAPRATTVLIGPSGCGKSTLLRIVAGLVLPDAGDVRIDGRPVTRAGSVEQRRAMGYVIQDGGLFPHLTAEANVTLLARYLRREPRTIEDRVDALAELVRLPRAALQRYPRELSGGQRQRVGIMRALMLDPDVLLLDEPFGALDPITRRELQEELASIFDRLDKTVLLVTHDLGEAAYLGETIVLMREGRVVQTGSLASLSDAPAEPYVREFLHAQRPLEPRPSR
jgi:osmoprotectant transport system ATP-binding protein